jgi:lysylphosphatidylglycerol synthetase-like protein (DUF2156 family)
MGFFARRIVIAAAVIASILTYVSLRQFAWAFDAAIAVGYTVMVLGDGLTVAFLRGHTLAGQKWTAIALTHACFLAVVVGVARLMYYLKTTDPNLTDLQKSGRTYYDLVAIVIVVVLGLVERMMLFRPKEEKKEKAKVTA